MTLDLNSSGGNVVVPRNAATTPNTSGQGSAKLAQPAASVADALDGARAWSPEYAQLGGATPIVGANTLQSKGICVNALSTGATARAPSAGTWLSKQVRCGFVTTAVAGNIQFVRCTQSLNGNAGYREIIRVAPSLVSANMRWFAGAQATTPPINVDPSAQLDSIGMGCIGGNVLMYTRGLGGGTVVDLGTSFPGAVVGAGLELALYCDPAGVTYWRVRRMDVAAVVTGSFNANLPTPGQNLSPQCWVSNNTDAVIDSLEFLDLAIAIPM